MECNPLWQKGFAHIEVVGDVLEKFMMKLTIKFYDISKIYS